MLKNIYIEKTKSKSNCELFVCSAFVQVYIKFTLSPQAGFTQKNLPAVSKNSVNLCRFCANCTYLTKVW
jgi:hypothetical protein